MCCSGDHFYVCGGRGDDYVPLSSCERYSFEKNHWEPIPSLPIGLAGASAVTWGRFLFLIGGCSAGSGWLNQVLRYETTLQLQHGNQWEVMAPMGQKRGWAAAVASKDQRANNATIVVSGGANMEKCVLVTCEQYNIANN